RPAERAAGPCRIEAIRLARFSGTPNRDRSLQLQYALRALGSAGTPSLPRREQLIWAVDRAVCPLPRGPGPRQTWLTHPPPPPRRAGAGALREPFPFGISERCQ